MSKEELKKETYLEEKDRIHYERYSTGCCVFCGEFVNWEWSGGEGGGACCNI